MVGTRVGRFSALTVLLVVMAVAAPAWAAVRTVELTAGNVYTPANVTIEEGDRVNFVWEGGFHDVVFADGTRSGAPTGDAGTTWSRTFNSTGTFGYICSVHEALGMTGSVTVLVAGDGTLPLTGPEETILPFVGVAMLLAGGFLLVRVRARGR